MVDISYDPNPVPESPEDLRRYINDELQRLRDTLLAIEAELSAEDFFFEVSKGTVKGHVSTHVIAFSEANTNATENDVWSVTSAKKTWLQAAATLEAVGTDANDTAAGTGAQTLTVYGLDANFNEITDTITMAGIGATAPTTELFLRVNSVLVTTAGAYTTAGTIGSNVGAITIQVSSGGTVEGLINAGEGVSENSHYTVPAGKKGYLSRMMLNVDAAKTSHFKMYMRNNASDVTSPTYAPRLLVHEWPGVSGLFEERTLHHYQVPEKSDIWMTCTPAANNTTVHIDYDVVLVDDGF